MVGIQLLCLSSYHQEIQVMRMLKTNTRFITRNCLEMEPNATFGCMGIMLVNIKVNCRQVSAIE